MAGRERSTGNSRPSRMQEAFARPLALITKPFLIIGALLGALLLSWLIEVIGMTLFWYGEGAGHARSIYEAEVAYLSFRFSLPATDNQALVQWATSVQGTVHYWLFEYTGVMALLEWLSDQRFLLGEYFTALIYVTKTFTVRIAVTVLAIPLFALFAVWGFGEGLIRRDLRRFGVDKERGMIYHESKLWLFVIFVLPVIIYFSYPFEINPLWVFPPFALLLGLNCMIMMATLTKHI